MHTTGVENQQIAKLYRDVPIEQVGRLKQFRADHPYTAAIINGVTWPYIVAGRGDTAILILPGALGTGESSWSQIAHFARSYRVIAPSYPPVTTMAELVDGIAEILNRETIGAAAVVGGSYGGFVAQVFVRRYPEKTRKLILSHTGYPEPARGKRLAGVLRLLALLPIGLLRALFRGRMAGLLPSGAGEAALFRAYFHEAVSFHLTKAGLINGYARVVDFDTHYTFTPHDLAAWPGSVLLIMADDDPATPASVRSTMQTLYPHAQVRLFSGTGHAAAILKRDEYFAAIESFVG